MIRVLGNNVAEISLKEYSVNGNTAIELIRDDGLPIAVITKNFDKLEKNLAYIDGNNCPWARKFLFENGFATMTDCCIASGYCIYWLVKLNLGKIKSYNRRVRKELKSVYRNR